MARRVMSTPGDDSQEENSCMRTQYEAEKTSQGKTAQTPEKTADGSDVESEDEDSAGEATEQEDEEQWGGHDEEEDAEGELDAEGEEEEDDEDQGGSSKDRKRIRVNSDGDSRPAGASAHPEKTKQDKLRALPRDVDSFIPGSIVRIQLKNFVTYDFVEFCPGPYLNMIFGPNGAGKSTIACAICLGLNFPPHVLGRASELKSFVKIGAEAGHIEIELKGMKGKPNLIIRRMLSAHSKSNSFTLNGRSASGKEINTRMAELNVQVGNLCTFLPQDKVSEFAAMGPQQLLRETQCAAGDSRSTSWHDSLISSGKELKQMRDALDANREQLKMMQERNSNLERDVRRYEERKKLEREIAVLELTFAFRQYEEAKELYAETRATKHRLQERVRMLHDKNAPTLNLKEDLTRRMETKHSEREETKSTVQRRLHVLQTKHNENEKLEGQADGLKSQLENLKETERHRKRNIERAERAIANMQRELDNPPEMESLDELNNQLRSLNIHSNAIRNRQSDLQDQQRHNIQEESRQKIIIQQQEQRLKELDDTSHRKLQDLTKWDRDSADVVVWLRENRHRFRKEVFEPPMLCCDVPDKTYVNAVEACFSQTQTKSFVAQCEEDYRLLNRLVIDTPDALGRKARVNTWFRAKDEAQLAAPPMSEQEMHDIGFDGYALQYVVYPEGLKWFLQDAVQLHRTAIALHAHKVDTRRAMEAVSRLGPNDSGGRASYVAGSVLNSVRRSKYGRRLPQNMTREIRPARNFVHSAVDPEVKQRIDGALAEATRKLSLCQDETKKLADDETNIQKEHREHKKEHDDVIARKDAAVKLQRKLAAHRFNIQKERDTIDELRAAPSLAAERARLRSELAVLANKRAGNIKNFDNIARSMVTALQEATRLGLEYLQAAANKDALETMCQEQEEEMQQAMLELRDARKRFDVAKEGSTQKLQIAKDKMADTDDGIQDTFREMKQSGEADARSADEVETELETKKARLDMNLHTNAGVVERFKQRKEEIKVLTETIEEKEKRMERVERTINATREHWQPALEELVASISARFSAAFDRLGCAGEVKIREHEDYDKWAIEIYVKFRDDEKLQLLTGARQSGGERSLTTILYLMSLTKEAHAPFSLVDEINQGMDERAERAVHNSLVEATCKAESGQYFLITPKLLPDLRYAEHMKVLCVNNGEWLPEQSGVGNMMSMIEGYVKLRASRAASSS